MMSQNRGPILNTVLKCIIGAFVGAVIFGVIYWWLYLSGDLIRLFLPNGPSDGLTGLVVSRTEARLAAIGPVILGWFLAFGAIGGGFWRYIIRIIDDFLIPSAATQEQRRLYLLGIVIASLAIIQYHVIAFMFRDPTDLPSFILAARAMAAGRDFYDNSVIASFADTSGAERVIFPYLYLPLYAVMMRPLALLTEPGAHVFFLFVNVLLWPTLIILCLKLIEVPDRLRGAFLLVTLLVFPSFLPAIQTFHHGSPSLLVAVLVVGVLVAERSERHRVAGVLLALGVLIKIVPVVVVAYFLLRRRFQALKWAAISGLLLLGLSVSVAGVEPHIYWLTEMAPNLSHGAQTGGAFDPGCHPENQALTGVFCRFMTRDSSFATTASVVGAIVFLLMMAALWRRREAKLDRLEGSLVVVTILIISTITWFHHMTMMLLPALTLIAVGAEGAGRGLKSLVVFLCGAIVLIVVGFEFYLDPWPFVVPNPLTRTLRFQAMIVAYVALLLLVLRSQPSLSRGRASVDETDH